MHSSTDTEEIKKALADLDHTVTNIWNIKQTSSKKPLDMFVIELQPKNNNKEIYNIKGILNCRIIFEHPRPKRSIPQCSNCQDYGHTKRYCRRKARCIKCAGYHASFECSRKERSDDVKCALCEGNHPANYKGCTVFKELQKQRYPPLRSKMTASNRLGQPLDQNKTYAEATKNARDQRKTNASQQSQNSQTPVEGAYGHDNLLDFKQTMDMIKEMMQQMSAMTNLLMNIMYRLHSHSDH